MIIDDNFKDELFDSLNHIEDLLQILVQDAQIRVRKENISNAIAEDLKRTRMRMQSEDLVIFENDY